MMKKAGVTVAQSQKGGPLSIAPSVQNAEASILSFASSIGPFLGLCETIGREIYVLDPDRIDRRGFLTGKKALEQQFLTAVTLGKTEDVNKYIKKGVDVNVTDQEKVSALHITAEKGDVDVGGILLTQKNIKINEQTTLGYTPLMIAVTLNMLEFTKLLLRYGANPNVTNYSGKTALHMAVHKDYRIVSLLLAFKASPNVVDIFGSTPLSLCIIEHPRKSVATCLLKKGADPNLTTIKAHPLLLEVCLNCNTPVQLDLVRLLLHFNADPNMTNRISKQTALHIVSITGYVPLAKLLLKKGADPKLKDIMNRTPMDMAIEHDHQDLVAFYKYRKQKMKCEQDDSIVTLKPGGSILCMIPSKKYKSVKFTENPTVESDEEIFLQQL